MLRSSIFRNMLNHVLKLVFQQAFNPIDNLLTNDGCPFIDTYCKLLPAGEGRILEAVVVAILQFVLPQCDIFIRILGIITTANNLQIYVYSWSREGGRMRERKRVINFLLKGVAIKLAMIWLGKHRFDWIIYFWWEKIFLASGKILFLELLFLTL